MQKVLQGGGRDGRVGGGLREDPRPAPAPAPGAPAALLGVSAPRAALALGAVNLVKSGGVPRGGQEVTAARASAEAPWL